MAKKMVRYTNGGFGWPLAIADVELLQASLDAISAQMGGSVHAPVADGTALKAIASAELLDRMLCLDETNGLYRYDAQSSAVENIPEVVTPTAVGVGSGRFIRLSLIITSHTHPQSEITSLVTALAGKVAIAVVHAPVADLTALKAIAEADRSEGMLCEVTTSGASVGFYWFDAAASDATDEPWVAVPAVGSGRWKLLAPYNLKSLLAAKADDSAMTTALAGKVAIAVVHAPVDSVAALRLVDAAACAASMLVNVADTAVYYYDTADVQADDGDLVVKPHDIVHPAPGRWLRRSAKVSHNHNTVYAALTSIHAPVSSIANLRLVDAAACSTGMVVAVGNLGVWTYDSADTQADDGDLVICPHDITHPAPGRWLRNVAKTVHTHVISDSTGLQTALDAKTPLTALLAQKADAAALRAVAWASCVDGQGVNVVNTGGYMFVAASSAADDGDYVLKPDDAGANPGRWLKGPPTHNDLHFTGGSDPIAPADIGAATAAHTHTIGQGTAPGADASLADVPVTVTSKTTGYTPTAGDSVEWVEAVLTATGAYDAMPNIGGQVEAVLDGTAKLVIKSGNDYSTYTLLIGLRR